MRAYHTRGMQAAYMVGNMLLGINVTLLNASALDLMWALHYGAVQSGLLICSCHILAPLGTLVGRLVWQHTQMAHARSAAVVLLILAAGSNAVFVSALLSNGGSGTFLFFELLSLRCVDGVAHSIATFLTTCIALLITPPNEMMPLSIATVGFGTLGLCLGFVLSSTMPALMWHGLTILPTADTIPANVRVAASMCPVAFLWALLALSVSICVPEDANPQFESVQAAANESLLPESQRTSVLKYCLIFTFERAFTVSAVESGTSMFLEVGYRWAPQRIGLVLGSVSAFSGLFILAILLGRRLGIFNDLAVLTYMASLGAVSTLFFFSAGNNSALRILAADMLLVACAFSANGVTDGFANNAVMRGTWYSIENFTTAKTCLLCTGRFLAAPVVRLVISTCGWNTYASLQTVIAISGVLTVRLVLSIMRVDAIQDVVQTDHGEHAIETKQEIDDDHKECHEWV